MVAASSPPRAQRICTLVWVSGWVGVRVCVVEGVGGFPPSRRSCTTQLRNPCCSRRGDTLTASELLLPATGIAMIFSFSSTGEGVRAGAGPGVCISTEIFNVSASPCRSKAVPKRKGGWVGTSTTGAPGGSLADPASRAAPAEGSHSCRDLDQPKKSAICADSVSNS